jgi:hypothetical protein
MQLNEKGKIMNTLTKYSLLACVCAFGGGVFSMEDLNDPQKTSPMVQRMNSGMSTAMYIEQFEQAYNRRLEEAKNKATKENSEKNLGIALLATILAPPVGLVYIGASWYNARREAEQNLKLQRQNLFREIFPDQTPESENAFAVLFK